MIRRAPIAAALLLGVGLIHVVAAPQAPPAVHPGVDPQARRDGPTRTATKTFEIRHRSLTDAAELAEIVLSPEGTLTLKPRLKMLVVRDAPEVVAEVEQLIAGFDLPPRGVEITLSLFIGRRPEPAMGGPGEPSGSGRFSREVRGVMETLGDFTVWTSYEPLGTQVIQGHEGSVVSAAITEAFGVQLQVGAVEDRVVSFDRLTLQETVVDEENLPRVEDRYTASLVVDAGKLTLVVAARKPDAPKALFLALSARPQATLGQAAAPPTGAGGR